MSSGRASNIRFNGARGNFLVVLDHLLSTEVAIAASDPVDSVQINNLDSSINAIGDTVVATTRNTAPQFLLEGSASRRWPLYKTDNSGRALEDVDPKSGSQKNWIGDRECAIDSELIVYWDDFMK